MNAPTLTLTPSQLRWLRAGELQYVPGDLGVDWAEQVGQRAYVEVDGHPVGDCLIELTAPIVDADAEHPPPPYVLVDAIGVAALYIDHPWPYRGESIDLGAQVEQHIGGTLAVVSDFRLGA
jgi:hypothetical protein